MAFGGICPRCGTPYQAGMSFCQGCGAPIAPAASVPPAAPPAVPETPATPATCPRCGALAAPGTRFCQSCGQPLEGSAPTPRPAGFADFADPVPEPVSPEPDPVPEPVAVTPYVVRTSTGERLELELPAVLGKGSAARVIIDGNPAISRAHARVSRTDEGCQIEDLGSTNGTFVDGVRLAAGTPEPLVDGAVVVLANEELVFHEG